MERGFRGVRADLSELARHLLDIACLLSPLVLAPTHADSPPPSRRPPSRALGGILSDIAEIRGGLRSGLSRLSTAAAAAAFSNPLPPPESRAGGVAEEVLEFIVHLVEGPESWLEFPVPVDDDFYMSHSQREHIATVERLVPSLTALRISLCPTHMSEECFWKIYFALLHPRLNKYDTEHLLTQQIVDSMRIKVEEMQHSVDTQSLSFGTESFPLIMSGGNKQLEDDQAQEASAITKTTSQQSICQWSEVPGDVGNATYSGKQSRKEDFSFRETGDGNVVLMERYMDQLLAEGGQVHSPPSSYKWDQLRKPSPGDDYDKAVHGTPQIRILFDEESSDWHAVDDFDFEVVGRPSIGKIM
ncbi:uncharacterized protein LOC103710128 [Phoenix dactylifera]|uniref:Uncharacterized protein LOC103710128 n=1 Tax=Phoenix dactylifera TaxID=42345 RepID=A0A8B7C8E6_PHODC|nr:uncharacterized protein LOC103710128 [Phoenix dactylifera]